MITTINIQTSKYLQEYLDKASTMPWRLLQAVAAALDVSGHIIVGNAVQHRFTGEKGPFPKGMPKLGRVTGRLRQSIRSTPPQIELGTHSVTMGFGSNVKYFGIHEFGFNGTVQVKAHGRKAHTIPGLNLSRLPQNVRQHSRKLLIVAREPMQSELRHDRTRQLILEQIRRRVFPILTGADLTGNGGTE